MTDEPPTQPFSLPKYTNLSQLEQKWVLYHLKQHGDARAWQAYRKLTWSIDNPYTQFMRYLHANRQPETNPFTIEAGLKKASDS